MFSLHEAILSEVDGKQAQTYLIEDKVQPGDKRRVSTLKLNELRSILRDVLRVLERRVLDQRKGEETWTMEAHHDR